jgi:DNA-binding beta-propeller fold protein YncE
MGMRKSHEPSAHAGTASQLVESSGRPARALTDRRRGSGRRAVLTIGAVVAFGAVPLASAFPAQASGGTHVVQAPNTPTAPTFTSTLVGASVSDMYSSGLEWDPVNQRLVVADTGNNEIEFYTFGSGTWARTGQFASFGSGPGQLNSPRDVAVDGSGNIYVADAGNSRIEKFDSNGNFVWATVGSQSKCLYPQRNTTCTNQPIGVSWDTTNNVLLVADTGDSYIKAFSASGTWVWTSPVGKGTKANLGAGDPRDAIRGPGGLIWVAAYDQNQIKAYAVSSAGVWATTPSVVLGDGTKGGHGVNQLIFPYNVEFSPDGTTAYVSDIGNDRVAVYDISNLSAPVWEGQYGSRCTLPCAAPKDAKKFLFLRRVVVVTDGPNAGDVVGDDFWGNQINVWAPPAGGILGAFVVQIEGVHAPAPGVAQAFGVTVAPSGPTAGQVYVVDRLNQRVEEFSQTGSFMTVSGVRGVGVDAFSWPEDAAVAPDGTVWLADTRNSRLEHWPSTLVVPSPYPNVGTKGPGVGQFNYIEGLTVDSHGVVWVADTDNNRIESYNPATDSFAVYGSLGSGNCQFNHPQAIAVSAFGTIYVADTLNNRVVEMTISGGECTSFAATYASLNGPQGIALSSNGTVWVADSGNDAIVHLTSGLINIGDGFGGLPGGSGPMQMNNPHSLAIYNNTLYVGDTYNNRVQVFNIALS